LFSGYPFSLFLSPSVHVFRQLVSEPGRWFDDLRSIQNGYDSRYTLLLRVSNHPLSFHVWIFQVHRVLLSSSETSCRYVSSRRICAVPCERYTLLSRYFFWSFYGSFRNFCLILSLSIWCYTLLYIRFLSHLSRFVPNVSWCSRRI